MPAAHRTSGQRWLELHGVQPGRQREETARRAADRLQLEADRLRKIQRWVRPRAWFLRRRPLWALCAVCAAAGRTEAACEVERVFDPANLQPHRGPCHARNSAAERVAGRDAGAT